MLLNSEELIFKVSMMAEPSRVPDLRHCRIFCSRVVSPKTSNFSCFICFGQMTPRTSSAQVQGWAPVLSSPLVPVERGRVISPGTAKSSLPCSMACMAVFKLPDWAAASTTITASERPEMRRFL